MANLNFRLPAHRNEATTLRSLSSHRMPIASSAAAGRGNARRVMNAEDAARIALRRLDADAINEAAEKAEDEPAACSGWFNSTWELAQGLDICEGLPADLPLDGWLQLYLAREPRHVVVSGAAASA